LATFGATVIITARDVKKGQRCVDELIDATKNRNIECQFLDFCDLQSIDVAVKQLCARLKRLDVLINCAALGFINSFDLTKDGHEVLYLVQRLC
jgi:NAD(P)-dependent dehydrogenase (short-subunit alcohol dehydrogenase family)